MWFLFALSIAVVVGVLQEGKASRAFHKLASSQERHATVIRGNQKHEILAEDLVPGDILVFGGLETVLLDVKKAHKFIQSIK